jgi:hypothetical protein
MESKPGPQTRGRRPGRRCWSMPSAPARSSSARCDRRDRAPRAGRRLPALLAIAVAWFIALQSQLDSWSDGGRSATATVGLGSQPKTLSSASSNNGMSPRLPTSDSSTSMSESAVRCASRPRWAALVDAANCRRGAIVNRFRGVGVWLYKSAGHAPL